MNKHARFIAYFRIFRILRKAVFDNFIGKLFDMYSNH